MFPAWRRRRCALGWLRAMARIALIVVLAAAALGTARPAGAWVFFYQTFGEWSVVCWRSHEGANDPRCSLSAPPDSHALGTRNVLHVQEYADRHPELMESDAESITLRIPTHNRLNLHTIDRLRRLSLASVARFLNR